MKGDPLVQSKKFQKKSLSAEKSVCVCVGGGGLGCEGATGDP